MQHHGTATGDEDRRGAQSTALDLGIEERRRGVQACLRHPDG